MKNMLQLAFVINGVLNSSFSTATSNAKERMQALQKSIKRVEQAQKNQNLVYLTGTMSLKQYTKNVGRLEEKLKSLKAQSKNLNALMSQKGIAAGNFNRAKMDWLTKLQYVSVAVSPLKSAFNVAVNFEKAMSKVGAIAGADGEQLERLTKTARSLGEKTQFSATQAAEAMSYLGMAGWKTDQIISGMPGLLNLAAAGNTDLARTADIVSDNLTAFGLSAKDAQHMADVYAVTITSTNTNVEMLGETMKYAAPVAHAFGVSMEETAAMAGLMANAGIKSSQAGTTLRAGLMRLAGPPKMAQKAMDELGMSLNDLTAEQKEASMVLASMGIDTGVTEGPQKMQLILMQLREKMKGLTKEQGLATASSIFGKQAAAGWLAMLQAEDGDFEKLTESLHNCDGAADKMAQKMNTNAKGAAIRMQSAWESLQISLLNGLMPAFADSFDTAARFTGKLSALATEFPQTTQFIMKTVLALGSLYVALITLNTIRAGFAYGKASWLLWKEAIRGCSRAIQMQSIYLQISRKAVLLYHGVLKGLTAAQKLFSLAMASMPIGWLILGIAALVVAGTYLYRNWDEVKQFFTNIWNNPTARLLMFITGPIGMLFGVITYVISHWDELKSYLEYFWENPSAAIFRFTSYIKQQIDDALKWVTDKWENIRSFLSTPIFGSVNITASGNGSGNGRASLATATKNATVASNAAGGIYGQGAFLTTFAENSGESAVPHTPTPRNIGILARTNEIMGNPLGVKKSNGVIHATFAPTITVQGNADTGQLAGIIEDQRRKFEEWLESVQHEQRRRSFA